jgi:hypothetical protein
MFPTLSNSTFWSFRFAWGSCILFCVGPRPRRYLAIGLLLAHSLCTNLRGVPDPQLQLQLNQQTLKLAAVSAGFHPHTHSSFLERPVKLLGFFAVSQPSFAMSTNAIC